MMMRAVSFGPNSWYRYDRPPRYCFAAFACAPNGGGDMTISLSTASGCSSAHMSAVPAPIEPPYTLVFSMPSAWISPYMSSPSAAQR